MRAIGSKSEEEDDPFTMNALCLPEILNIGRSPSGTNVHALMHSCFQIADAHVPGALS